MKRIKCENLTIKVLLFLIVAGVWVIVLQNFGVIDTPPRKVRNVGVVDIRGYVGAEVSGEVSVENLHEVEYYIN